jgi:hypothetical protein
VLQDLLPVPGGMMAVDLSDGRRVFAPEGTNPEAVRLHVAERETKQMMIAPAGGLAMLPDGAHPSTWRA